MKVKNYLHIATLLFFYVWSNPIAISQSSLPRNFTDKRFSLNIKNSSLTEALRLIAKHGELKLKMGKAVKGNISFVFEDKTLEHSLAIIAKSENLNFKISNNTLSIWKKKGADSSQGRRAPNNLNPDGNHIYLKYLSADDVHSKLKTLMDQNENIIVDNTSNSIAVFASESTYERVRSYIAEIDKMPQQLLIEAQIIEIKKNKSRELGINYGDVSNINLSKITKPTGQMTTPGPQDPFGVLKFGLGSIAGRVLETRIAMAESQGDAKVISRPKIITLNNVEASINSGITFNVKTLTTNPIPIGGAGALGGVGGGFGQANNNGGNIGNSGNAGNNGLNGNISAGIQQITAGLSLNVLPTIVGENKIKLAINVTNSEPDESTGVDGIPGIVDNSAKSTLIIESGKTAVLAGLIKNSKSKSQGGIPFLSKIPILGVLFRGSTRTDRDFETLIFITPKIIPTSLEANTQSIKEDPI